MFIVIGIGIVRNLLGDLPKVVPHAGTVGIGTGHVAGMLVIFYFLKAFANGGSSLTGLEAISNGVSVFHKPSGVNARKTLVVMSCILGTIVAGVSWLAFETKAEPYQAGSPTVISQVVHAVLGDSLPAHLGYLFVQFATMLILYTGANTPFNGFPFLASFVAEDQFLPRQLRRRGHRLAFSNGIIILTIAALALLIFTNGQVDKLVAFYAIGVFTGFTLAGFGMAKYFRTHRQKGSTRKIILNSISGVVSLLVVLILFPVGVFALFRLNRQYRREAETLVDVMPEAGTSKIVRHNVIVLVDNADLATIAAVRYALSMGASTVRAVHFVIDQAHADELLERWSRQATLTSIPLNVIACPDRRLTKSVLQLAVSETTDRTTELTLLLSRRTYGPLLGRILHDHTADDIARAISQQPRVVATIIPFDVDGLIERRRKQIAAAAHGAPDSAVAVETTRDFAPTLAEVAVKVEAAQSEGLLETVAPSTVPKHIDELNWRGRATVSGVVRSVRMAAVGEAPSLEVELWDESGGVLLLFYGRRSITAIETGRHMTASGTVGQRNGKLAIANPVYRLDPIDSE
jgi:amino acid transporter